MEQSCNLTHEKMGHIERDTEEGLKVFREAYYVAE